MTPEHEFAKFIAEEAERRNLSYFCLVGNNETGKFSYRTAIFTDKDGQLTEQHLACVRL